MTTELEQQLSGLLTPTEAARAKRMSLQLFKYYLRDPGSPVPVVIGKSRQRFFWPDEVKQWVPRRGA